MLHYAEAIRRKTPRRRRGVFAVKVKITLDRWASPSIKSDALAKIIRELGSKAIVTGDVITVESDFDERKVIDILSRERINYSRSSY